MADTLDRIRKLLRLTESPNEHEATSAKHEAIVLMDRHGLTMADVAETMPVEVVADSRRDLQRVSLAVAVARYSRCSAAVTIGGSILFCGARQAVGYALDHYQRLVEHVEEESPVPETWGDPPAIARDAWRECFWLGFVAIVENQLSVDPGENEDEAKPALRPTPSDGRSSTVPTAAENAARIKGLFDQMLEEAAAAGRSIVEVIERFRAEALHSGRASAASLPRQRRPPKPVGRQHPIRRLALPERSSFSDQSIRFALIEVD